MQMFWIKRLDLRIGISELTLLYVFAYVNSFRQGNFACACSTDRSMIGCTDVISFHQGCQFSAFSATSSGS